MVSNTYQSTDIFQHKADIIIPVIIALLLAATKSYHFLLFHTLAELFSIIVAITMAVVAWHTYSFTRNHFFTYLGIGYFWVATMDLAHLITYKGMGIFAFNDAQVGLEYWIFSRYFEAMLLLCAPFFLRNELRRTVTTIGFGLYFMLITLLAISGVLPEMFSEESGLTSFKVNSEYIIIGILIAAGALFYHNRNYLEKSVLHLLLISIGFTILAEFCFTSYVNVYGNFNLLGHIFKFFSFWCIYLSIIRTTLSKPYQVMARGASTYNAITLPALLIDHNGIIHQSNQAAQSFSGLAENELLNRHCHAIFHSQQLSQAACPICQHIDQNKPLTNFELEFLPAGIWQNFTLSPFGLMGDLEGLVHVSEDITQRKQAEQALQESDEILVKGQEIAHIGNWKLDPKTGEMESSDELLRILGFSTNKISFTTFINSIHPEEREGALTYIQKGIEEDAPWEIEYRLLLNDGTEKWAYTAGEPKLNEYGKTTHVVGIVQDITERKLADEMLRRTQKMDAIGQLTGGIAHDFNNLLSIIIGNLGFLEHLELADEKSSKRIEAANKAALRAAKLTKQLLGFSRRQAQNSVLTDINGIIQDMDSLITRSVTPQVEVEYRLAANLWLTHIDPGDFEDTLLNLAINARDAMPKGGKLTIETSNQCFDHTYADKNPPVVAGEYTQIAISDTGIGMSAEVQEHIFDPFFTTKPQGQGTGLGMSMVFGFIKRSKGHIKIYSEPGIGTTIRLYLPRTFKQGDAPQSNSKEEAQPPHGQETILAVDDEEDLLELAQEYLINLGYKVVTAKDGHQALEQLAKHANIDLLFSDVVMPGGMNGYELAEQATLKYPKLKVLLTSGFTSKAMAKNGQARFNTHLLVKPYRVAELANRVRKILDLE